MLMLHFPPINSASDRYPFYAGSTFYDDKYNTNFGRPSGRSVSDSADTASSSVSRELIYCSVRNSISILF